MCKTFKANYTQIIYTDGTPIAADGTPATPAKPAVGTGPDGKPVAADGSPAKPGDDECLY